MTIQPIDETHSRVQRGQHWLFRCNLCGSDHITKTGLNIHITKKHTTMTPTPHWPCPDDRAEFIGSTTANDQTHDYWARTFRDNGEIYLFSVVDDDGSFATITLPYTTDGKEPPMNRMSEWMIWSQTNGNQSLKMPAPSSSWYPGMHSIAFKWLWNNLFPAATSSKRTEFQIHSKAECHSRWVFAAHQKLKKAGIPLTNEQFELLMPPQDEW